MKKKNFMKNKFLHEKKNYVKKKLKNKILNEK